jgi:hypothetical protein
MTSEMDVRSSALRLLDQEVRALGTRLERVQPFALQETMVSAAAPAAKAQAAIDIQIRGDKQKLRRQIAGYRAWLDTPEAKQGPIARAQRRLTFLRLRFNAILSQVDIFADVITQRSEHETGVWLRGMDEFAADALALPGNYYRLPCVVCYLDRGQGAAIRRARTRLPGGSANPVAVIRVPRERMIGGSGIGSSIAHEVGHQGAALLDLVNSLRPELRRAQQRHDGRGQAWHMFERWISEIVADLWSVSRVGIASTLGLMGVVSLPRVFVFKVSADDPHPIPWIRVKLSCAIGKALYPDPQWDLLAGIWDRFYALSSLNVEQRRVFTLLEATLSDFVQLLLEHRPESLQGVSLFEALHGKDRTPARLRTSLESWRANPEAMLASPPSLALAAISQAKSDGVLSPEAEGEAVSRLLTHWALSSVLRAGGMAVRPPSPSVAVALLAS